MKTIEVIKQKCEIKKNEVITELSSKIDFSQGIDKAINSLADIDSQINTKLKPLGEDIKLIIESSNEDKDVLEKQASVIMENTLSEIFGKFF
ncbi:hypothetical protein [Polaribacter butkevichii]|uniref:Uncharacterized protein n=1 Tax=Polaribacter butkevichii TaxID=218490 RepID=A0A2P6CFE2_9FLAO|nr:hypothetical protein [Polaribacter butkevichii]PQJ73625.1 hypothetical protein BTO14_10250 [Polaribacter butkevichii]